MKKTVILWVLALLFAFGGKVHAADSRANAILDETEKVMKEVKVIGAGMLLDGTLLTELEIDKNNGVAYMSLLGEGMIWIDSQSQMSYIYSKGKYYFEPLEDGDLDLDTDFSTEVDRTLDFTYIGEAMYKVKEENVNCYKLSGIHKEQDSSAVYTYYISTDSYRMIAIEGSTEGMTTATYYYYPESVTVPQEAREKAVIMEGYSFTVDKVTYKVEYVKGNPVLYVTGAKSAKGNVKLPDTVSILEKKYKVYAIDAAAFKNNKKITSVTIGKYVHTIGKQAFYNCKKLKSVRINSTVVTKIGTKAFYKNAKTLKFKLPKKKASKYKKLIEKSKVSSRLVISQY